MRKIVTTILVAVATSATLPHCAWAENSTDVLFWYINTEEDQEKSGAEFDTIKFWAVDANNNKVNLASRTYTYTSYLLAGTPSVGSGDTFAASPGSEPPTSFDGYYYTNLTGLDSGYSFLMELYRGGTRVDWMLQPVSWDDFSQYVVSGNLTPDFDLQAPDYYNFASTMVPEPTSGLLFLVGGALLALRRRRAA